MEYHAFGKCPVCGLGLLIAVKVNTTGELMLLCEECEVLFVAPDEAKSPRRAPDRQLTGVGPATLEEINSAGWSLPEDHSIFIG